MSNYSNHGVLKGAKWENGKFNKSLMFDGTAWVDVGNDESLDLNGTNFTIALWVNLRGKPNSAFVTKDVRVRGKK